LPAFHISSIAMSIVMGLRRKRKPMMPMTNSALATVK
jgi:hypothetical protein